MKQRKEFLGLDGFYWWFGVVENRKDPKGLGRCQVRIYGAHNSSLSDIPSEDLPWAHPVHSLNNQMFSTPKEGDMVFGFFVDGKFAQQPVMMGILPVTPTQIPNGENGFNDIRTPEELAESPKKPVGLSYSSDGLGVTIIEQEDGFDILRNPTNSIGYPSNSDLARNENINTSFIQSRRDSLVSVSGAFGTSWKEPFPAYAAKYPYNKVMETESGHIQEFDDTPKNERIHTAHRSGTFEEIYPTGTKVEKIVKNNYKIILADDHLYVTGKVNITVESHAHIKVVGDVNLECQGDFTAGIAGDANFSVGGDFKVKAANIYMESNFDNHIKADGAVKIATASALHLDTSKLNLISGNDISIISDGTLNLGGSRVIVNSKLDTIIGGTLSVGIKSDVFNVLSPTSNFGSQLNAVNTNLTAYGTDSHGDSHVLSVGMGVSVPVILPSELIDDPTGAALATVAATTPSASLSFLGDPPTIGDATIAPKFFEPTPADNAGYFFDAGEDPKEVDAYIQTQIESGIYTQSAIDEGEKIAKDPLDIDPNYKSTKPNGIIGTKDCGGIDQLTDIPQSMMLSKYYSVKDLSSNVLKPQRGFTKGQIACNLKLLALNCLDPIKKQYPTMKITSAFRYPTGEAAGRSQHEIGQAADMQFDGIDASKYFDIVLWIKNNIAYDQLILEYKTTSKNGDNRPVPWIHISYNKEKNRAPGSNKNLTMMNHKVKYNYFVNLVETPLSAGQTVVTVTTTTDPETKITTQVTQTENNLEVVTETVQTSESGDKIPVKVDGEVVAESLIEVKKKVTPNPKNGPSGLFAEALDSATEKLNDSIVSAASDATRGIVSGITDPILRQLESAEKSADDISKLFKLAAKDINKAVCTIVHDGRILVGKIKRLNQTLTELKQKAQKIIDKVKNQTKTYPKGLISKAIAEASQKLADEIEKAKVALIIKLRQQAELIEKTLAAQLAVIDKELGRVYGKLAGIYYKLVINRAKLAGSFRDKIRTFLSTYC